VLKEQIAMPIKHYFIVKVREKPKAILKAFDFTAQKLVKIDVSTINTKKDNFNN
jgi:hypothetical protein